MCAWIVRIPRICGVWFVRILGCADFAGAVPGASRRIRRCAWDFALGDMKQLFPELADSIPCILD